MPTNLPPEYYDAEKRFRSSKTPAEKLACLDEMISIVPKHKGTDKLRADLRKRVSKLKSAAQAKKSLGRHESAYHIKKEGAGQVVIVGATNVGKSALVARVTNASPEVADFPLHAVNFSGGQDLDIWMTADLDRFRCEDSRRAVVCGKGLVELGHVSTDAGPLLDQIDLETSGGHIERGLDPADPPTHDHHVSVRTVSVGAFHLPSSF